MLALADGAKHGYAIKQDVEQRTDGVVRLGPGTLYEAIQRLEAAGLIKAEWEQQMKGRRGPRRRIYRLTAKGSAALSRGRAEWLDFARVIGGIM